MGAMPRVQGGSNEPGGLPFIQFEGKGSSALSKYSIFVLLYSLPVIVYGAFVRASGSGDGCANHWPDCNGVAIPLGGEIKTWIEYAHRFSSGLVLPFALVLMYLVFRNFGKGSPIRKVALGALFFTVTEALIGMALVRKGLVAQDHSPERAWWLAMHLTNTFMLLGCFTSTAYYANKGSQQKVRQGPVSAALVLGLLGVLILGISGAVTALGDTLYPAKSITDGLLQDVSPTAHFLIKLRLFHPLIATSIGVFLLVIMGWLNHVRPSKDVKKWSKLVVVIFFSQMAVGFVNVILLAPIWMQLVHLLLADGLWVVLLLCAHSVLSAPIPDEASQSEATAVPTAVMPRTWKTVLGEYIALTKPRVISLLLFTTITAMFAAKGGWPGGWLLLAVTVGGYMSAGAANAINMVIDRDIDGSMKRTSQRPTVTQNITSRNALIFGFLMELGSFLILWSVANLLAAMLAFVGLLFYVIVYTIVLKRRTWHNIVIGGAAGAVPPLVGWAAVTNHLTPLAWYLFAIVFVWTPVHFWALALMIKDDYAKAGVPMLPVVLGERVTVIQIGLYAILTAVVSVMPLFQGQVGLVYVVSAIALNALLLVRCAQLYFTTDRPHALVLYKYSMVYLALLFLMVAVDQATKVRG